MSSENDQTVPVPTTGAGAPTAPIRRSAAQAPTGGPPTTPVPRAGAPAGSPDPGPSGPVPDTAPSGPVPDTGPSGRGAAAGSPTDTSTDRPVGARTSRPPVRVGTVVWGLVLAVVGAGIIAVAAGAQIDVELALIGLLALAGFGLVVGSVVTGVRRRH